MRKDVRTGAVIGGLLIAVLIIYGVVASRSHDKKTATGPVAVAPDKNGPETAAPDAAPTAPDATPALAASGDAPPNAGNPGIPPIAPPGANPGARGGATPDATKTGANWATLLQADDLAGLMPVKTQTPDGSAVDTGPRVDTRPPVTDGSRPPAKHSDPINIDTPGPVAPPSTSDNTPAAPAASSSYVVKSGDTLSSIARSAYGDARLYKKIMEANPKINPSRMRAGITITLPGRSQLSHESAMTDAVSIPTPPVRRSSAKQSIPVDSATEYRVVSNDNLYRISMKLYNTPNKVDLIYQFNKTLIGPDPARLKLNMVLKLPEPPTQTASTR